MMKSRKIGALSIRPEVKQGKETGKWFLDIPETLTADGKRKRRLYPSRTAAEGVARELKQKFETRKLGYSEATPKRGLPFKDAVERFDHWIEIAVKTGDLQSLTARTYRTRLKNLNAHFGGQSVTNIDANAINEYKSHRADTKIRAVTINGELRVLRRLLGWLAEQGELAAPPRVKKIREKRRPLPIPSATEVVQLLDHLRPSVRVLVWLMAETGLRPSEAQNLPWVHVNAKNGIIMIKPFGEYDPKNEDSHRSVFPSPELMRELLRLSRTGVYVFPGTDPAKPIQNVRTALKTAAKKAGLTHDGKPFVPTVKLFRKAFATTLAERGVNQSIVGAMMGHAPGSRMTAQYYQFFDDDAKRANRLSLHDMASRGIA